MQRLHHHFKSKVAITVVVLLLLTLSLFYVLAGAEEAPEAWDGTVATEFAGGTGTAADPWLIENGAQLALMAQRVNGDTTSGTIYRKGFYKLTADIVLNAGAFAEDGTWSEEGTPHQWTPIGTDAKKFWGNFNGDGHTISGLYIDGNTAGFIGLFGYVLSSDIYDFDVVNSYVNSTGDNVGLIIGAVRGSGVKQTLLTNVTADGFVFGQSRVGGIAGVVEQSQYDYRKTIFQDCTNYAQVTGTLTGAGGIVGNSITIELNRCINYGEINGVNSVGGLGGYYGATTTTIGTQDESSYFSSMNYGAVKGSGSSVGGIYGKFNLSRGSQVRITNCLNAGSVEGLNEVGGIIGIVLTPSTTGRYVTVLNSLMMGTVTAAEGQLDVGMLIGRASATGTNSKVQTTYSYYLPMGELAPVGTTTGNVLTSAYAITEAQLNGTSTDIIDETLTHTNTTSVVMALNNLLAEVGSISHSSWILVDGAPQIYRPYTPQYTVTPADTTNGEMAIVSMTNGFFPDDFPATVYSAETILGFTVTANEGYLTQAVSYTYQDSEGVTQTLTLAPDSEGVYTFEMPAAAVTINLTFIATDAEGVYAITYLACEGVTQWSAYLPTHHFVGQDTLIPQPVKEGGSIFMGWLVNDSEEPVMALTLGADDYTAEITLTATWQEKQEIELDGEVQNSTYLGSAIAYVPTGTDATLPGYTISYLVVGEWTQVAPVNAGTYSVKLERTEDDEYKAYAQEIPGGLVIDKAASGITDISDLSRVYNAQPVGTPTYIRTGDGAVSIEYYDSENHKLDSAPVNAGSYKVKVIVAASDNYYGATAEVGFTIAKALINMAGVSWNYTAAFVYNRSLFRVELTGLPAGVTAAYSGNTATDAGTYTASVTFTYDSDNYESIAMDDLTWTINKASLAGLLGWDYESAFTYDGTAKTVSVLGLPGDVTVNYTDNTGTGAGTYTAKATFVYNPDNYESISLADLAWEITKATIDMSGVAWDYTVPFTYSGSSYTVALTGLPAGVSAHYTGNTATGAGTYTAGATFEYDTDNYESISVADLAWEIAKATIDMSEVVWDYPEPFVYSGAPFTVSLTGLPAVVSATYEGNSATDAGSYTATVTLVYDEGNYEVAAIPALEWVIQKRSLADVVRWDYTVPFTYNGTERTVLLLGLPADVSASYTGNTATLIGHYTATVTFTYGSDNYEALELEPLEWMIKESDSKLRTQMQKKLDEYVKLKRMTGKFNALKEAYASYELLEDKEAQAAVDLLTTFQSYLEAYNAKVAACNEAMSEAMEVSATLLYQLKETESIKATVADIRSKLESDEED